VAQNQRLRKSVLNAALPIVRAQRASVQLSFIALLKPPFKSCDDYPKYQPAPQSRPSCDLGSQTAQGQGDCTMARFEILDGTAAPLGEGPAAADMLFELVMMYSVGRDVLIDLVSARTSGSIWRR
jgi:hypothetical protein